MIQEDFYTGEPVQSGSPAISQNSLINTGPAADIEAANMASFGKYDYDPCSRQIPTAPVSLYNGGGYGGYFNPYQQSIGGIGAPPPQYGYTPYGNPQPSYGYYKPYGFQQQPQQPQYQQQTTYHIPGVNISGEFLPPSDYEKRIAEMEMEYFTRQQDIEAKQNVERQSSVYGYGGYGGYNYYGVPYFNPYQYNALNNEFSSRIEAMKDEARENRMQFNLNIARLAHNFSGQTISEEDLIERYTGKTVNIPQAYLIPPEEYYGQLRFMQMVPFDNSQLYRDHRAAIQREYNKIIPENADLKETFDNMGIIASNWELEEEQHRRKNAGVLYNSGDNSYKYFVRRKAQERYAREKGIVAPTGLMPSFNANAMRQDCINTSPILSQSAHLADDGTLNVSLSLPCNVGSHKGETYSVHNSQQAEYEEKRERFGRFLDSIPGTIYLDQQKQKKIEGFNNG